MLSRFARSTICAASALALGVGFSRSNYALPFARANADSASPAAAAPAPKPSNSAAPQKNGKSEAAAAFPFKPKSKAKSKDDGEEECEVCSDRADDFFKQINSVGKARPAAAAGAGWEGEGLKCPLDRREVGRSTWDFLHTAAVVYPELPTPKQQADMATFLHLVAEFYPCGYCADRMKDELILHPPVTHSRRALMQWMCELHNEVNDRMGKQTFDCSKYEERWRTGPADGSCGTRKKKAAASPSAAAAQ